MISKICLIFSLAIGLGQICYSQTSRPTISRTQALREVKVTSVGGWKEVVSEQGRFRVLFPGTPMVSDEVATMTGFKFTGRPGANWFAYFSDLNSSVTDDVQLRRRYRESVEAIAMDRSRLLRQNDIYLNGKLGTEFVVEGRGAKSYMRSFLVGSRLWVLSVDASETTNGDSTTPKDVQQFFDSFTFWE